MYVKGDFTPNQAAKWSDVYIPSTPYESRPPIYLDLLYNRYGSATTSPFNYRPRSTPYHMTSPFLTSASPYYNPRQSDSYLPSYDNDLPRNNVFMSPGYYLSSPINKRSERTCEENEVQRSPSTNRNHIYHHIYLPSSFATPSNSTSTTTSSTANKNAESSNN